MVEEKLLKFIEIDAQYPRKYYKGYVNKRDLMTYSLHL